MIWVILSMLPAVVAAILAPIGDLYDFSEEFTPIPAAYFAAGEFAAGVFAAASGFAAGVFAAGLFAAGFVAAGGLPPEYTQPGSSQLEYSLLG